MADLLQPTARLVLGGPTTLFLGGTLVLPWYGPVPGPTVRHLMMWWFEARIEAQPPQAANPKGTRG